MKLLAIDGNSILNRAYYGIRPLSNSKGLPTNALFGFLNIILKHIEEDKPDKICVAFDLKEKTYRNDLFEGYKANRTGMPDDLAAQLPYAKKLLDAMGITRIEKAGLEADDIIGILSQHCTENNDKCIILTGDRDSFQLIDDNVTVKLASTKQGASINTVYGPAEIFDKYGLTPDKMIDLKALMGDSSDNIPGVKGIGEKTALALLKEYGSLDGVYENADKIKGAAGEKIRNDKENAYLSKRLGTIIRDSDIGIAFENINLPVQNDEALRDFLRETEMTSFLKRFAFENGEKTAEVARAEIPETISSDGKDFKGQKIFVKLSENNIYIYDGESIYKTGKENIDILRNPAIIMHDAKPLISVCMKNGFNPDVVFDTMLAAYILDPSQTLYSEQRLFSEYLNIEASSDEETVYNMSRLYEKLNEELEKNGQKKLYEEIELPLCFVLADMENEGVETSSEFLEKFGEETEDEINELSYEIYRLSGKEFNINSPKQLGELLFKDLMLTSGRKTKTGYSTDNEVLESLIGEHPIIELIIRFRQLSKLKSTYVDGLLKKIDSGGRIHSNFTQTVTQTGRISSVDPNLQNIPVRTPLGRQLRHAFTAKKGCKLVDADYSQIELRVLAHISGDENMQKAFRENMDIHTSTASQVFGFPPEMITPELRSRAKAVNFGIVYGIGDFSLAKDIGISRKEAKAYIDSYLTKYQGVSLYMKTVVSFAQERGYVETLFGRRRYVSEINSKNKNIQAFGKRISMNTPIQGTAADLIKIAMIRVSKALKEKKLNSKLILQVHDELIVEAPENEVESVKEILKKEMESAADLSVPLIADVNSGDDWFETH